VQIKIIIYIVGFAVGVLGAGLLWNLLQSRQAGKFDERIAELTVEYEQRQREIESGLSDARRIISDARGVVESAAESLGRTTANITEAIAIIREIREQIQDLDYILNGGSAGGSGDWVLGRVGDE